MLSASLVHWPSNESHCSWPLQLHFTIASHIVYEYRGFITESSCWIEKKDVFNLRLKVVAQRCSFNSIDRPFQTRTSATANVKLIKFTSWSRQDIINIAGRTKWGSTLKVDVMDRENGAWGGDLRLPPWDWSTGAGVRSVGIKTICARKNEGG